MKLSIIIPLYNTEDYIEKCILSIYSNLVFPLSDFEVIVINDGSRDRSEEIVDKLTREYSNLILINKENGGQSTARNIGFKLAKGDYIFCLDSDDFVDNKILFQALNYCIDKNLDIMPIFHRIFDENYNVLPTKKDLYPVFENIISGGEFLNTYVVSGSMWRYFYKKEIIVSNSLYLTEGIYHEDEEFIMKFLSYSRRVAYPRFLVYNHIVRSNSTVNRRDKTHRIKLLNDILKVIEHLNKHKEQFEKNTQTYLGLSKKVEQLAISLFLRMKQDKLNRCEVENFINKLEVIGMFPLKSKHLNYKFRIAKTILNNRFLRQLYFR
ncbi:glycosyltransferase family 2 protein [Sphingobacterium mizutaii]|uniref:glycosyltransferase family 2 protein n=1 Tax=Sphingobacterium mizutaii TaxID=1010 RepID=UPI003D9775EC